MKIHHLTALFFLSTTSVILSAVAQQSILSADTTSATESTSSSTSSDSASSTGVADARSVERTNMRPFSTVAIGAKAAVTGIGIDIATPVGPRLNARLSGGYFAYNTNIRADKIVYNGDLQFRRGNLSLDYFPFSGKFREGFRISPGLSFYDGNSGTATTTVAPGQYFFLNGVQYTSSATDPVHGTANLDFGRKIAPSITVGFGNMIPRDGAHWSIPFEIGFDYVGRPTVALNLAGTACQPAGCSSVASSAAIQNNIKGEQTMLANDLSGFRFWPVASIGIAYRFGH